MSVRREFERGGEVVRCSAERQSDGSFSVTIGDRSYSAAARRTVDGQIAFSVDGGPNHIANCAKRAEDVQIRVDGRTYVLPLHRGQRAGGGGASGGDGVLRAPMTGTVLQVLVEVGQEVTAGETLAVVSAMKMEHKLVADIDGFQISATP